MSLASKLVAIHQHLDEAKIAHAFGGAIALAYCTQEPRGTIDLDINVFATVDRAPQVFAAFPEGVDVTAANRRTAELDGQVRIWWGDTPLDLFFSYHPFHEEIAERIRTVAFEGIAIPVLDCTDLVIFKALFGRTKDWADIEAVASMLTVDQQLALATVEGLLGPDHDSIAKLNESFERASRPPAPDPNPLGGPTRKPRGS